MLLEGSLDFFLWQRQEILRDILNALASFNL